MGRFTLIITVLLVASACSKEPTSMASETTLVEGDNSVNAESTQAVVSVDGDELTAAERCSEQSIRSGVESFVDAYSNGEPDLTERFFAGEDRYQWYSEPPNRMSEDETGRETLDRYLAQRHAEGDRLRIVELSYNGYRVEDETGHFDYVVHREGVGDVLGKGAIDCRSGGIMVWSLGPNPEPTGT